MQSHKKKIFISYQRKHEEEIIELVIALEKEGKYDVWYDQKMIRGKWWDNILEAIRDSDVIILALSSSYLISEPCRRERIYAQDLKKAIVPVRVDERLEHTSIPREIVEWQINNYYGKTREFQTLQDVLDQEQSPPLPDPLPAPPDAPIDAETDEPVDQTNAPMSIRLPLIFGSVAAAIIIIIALIVMNQSSTNSNPTESVDNNQATGIASSAATPSADVVASGEPGDFSFDVMFGGLDSLIIYVKETSNLNGVTLNTATGTEENLIERFTDLAFFGDVVTEGICLVYEREDSRPVLPVSCDTNQVLRRTVSGSDVFWYDDGTNLYNNIVVRQGDGEQLTKLCPHQNGTAVCSVSTSD